MVGQRVFTNSFDPNIIIIDFHSLDKGVGVCYHQNKLQDVT